MSDREVLRQPTNQVVAVFDSKSKADAAHEDFLRQGFTDEQVRVWQGEGTTIDTSDKWFADTGIKLARYQRELESGNTIVAAPVEDKKGRERVHEILTRHDARLITHFGEWVTEMMKS